MKMEGKCGEELDRYLREIIMSGDDMELQGKWVTSNSQLREYTEQLFPEVCQNHCVFAERSGERPKCTVTICSVKGTQYEHLHDANNTTIYAGGPGSMVGAALDSVLSSQDQANVMYVTYDFEHSNARSSAYYFHVRHSNALNADSWVRGHQIIHEFLRRQFLSKSKLLEDSQRLSYLKVDISLNGVFSSPSHFIKTLSVLCGGLWHTLKNMAIEKANPSSTDWARNRLYSQYSIPVLRYLELMGKQLGVVSKEGRPTLLVGTELDSPTCEAIHVVFDERGAKHTEEDNVKVYETNGIESRELSHEELVNIMGGDGGEIYKGYVYPGDGRIPADMNIVLRDIVERSGHSWKEGVQVKSVYVDKNGVRGVEFQDVTSHEVWYQPCSSVVLSLGYTAQYQTEIPHEWSSFLSRVRSLVSILKHKIGFKTVIPNTTVAAGCSGYFLVKGKIPIIGAQNSHWTEVAYSPEADITLGKLTGGGNIGSEHIPATYPLNNLEHLKKLFGPRLIDVLSIDSCPRAINSQNDVQFYHLVPGVVVSVGLGGTGMTKCGANGALSYLLTHPEAKQSQLIPGASHLFSSIQLDCFVTDRTSSTLRALGLQKDYSFLEIASFASVCLGVYFFTKFLFFRSDSVLSHKRSIPPAFGANSPTPQCRLNFNHKFYYHHRSLHINSCHFPHTGLSSSFCCSLRLLPMFKKMCRIRL